MFDVVMLAGSCLRIDKCFFTNLRYRFKCLEMAVDGFDDEISWSAFTKRKTRPQGKDADGYTQASYHYSYDLGKQTADVVIALDPNQSWVVEDMRNDELLKHEQGHYDITALGAREFYATLVEKVKSSKTSGSSITTLNEKFQRNIKRTNQRYDTQTGHSRLKAEQEKWNKAIAAEKQKLGGSLDNLP